MIIVSQSNQTPLWTWRPEKPSHQLFGISPTADHGNGKLTRHEHLSPYVQTKSYNQVSRDDHTDLPKGSSQVQVNDKHTVPSSFAFDDVVVTEDDDKFNYETDLPGVKTNDLVVELEDGVIDIRAQKHRSAKTYHRRFRIGDQDTIIDSTQLSANLSVGVLTISVPKKSKNSNKAVQVLVENSEPPEGDSTLNLEVDMPGVKAENVRVVLILHQKESFT